MAKSLLNRWNYCINACLNAWVRLCQLPPCQLPIALLPIFFRHNRLFFYSLALSLQSIFKNHVMYAIVEIAGKQFKVSQNQYIYAPKMEGDAGTAVSFEKVLLTDSDGSVQVGSPTVSGVKVSGKILEHVKGDKVIVFKKKRRKGYAKRNGHRQQFTKVQIETIG